MPRPVLSPWLLTAAVGGGIMGLRDRPRRVLTACVRLAPVPYLVAMSLANKKFDRYGLPVVPFLALAAGIGFGLAWEHWRASQPSTSIARARWVGVVAALLLALPVLGLAPYAHAFVNPVVGTDHSAEIIMRGRGEGLEQVGELLLEREGGRCDEIEIAVRYRLPPAFPCGRLREPTADAIGTVDYVVVYINQRQRQLDTELIRWAEQEGELALTISILGLTHVWLYEVPRADTG